MAAGDAVVARRPGALDRHSGRARRAHLRAGDQTRAERQGEQFASGRARRPARAVVSHPPWVVTRPDGELTLDKVGQGERTAGETLRLRWKNRPGFPPGGASAPAAAQAAATAAAAASEVAAGLGPPAARPVIRCGTAAAVLALARAAGLGWTDLGLGRRELPTGMRLGMVAGGSAAAATFALAAGPATRRFLRAEREAGDGRGGLAGELARITFLRVPAEELTYRSGLMSLRLASGSPAGAIAWPSLLFGLSHIAPALADVRGGRLEARLAGRPLRQAVFVAGNVAVTGAAGAGFAWLRLRSGSVAAALLAHAALNDSALLADRLAGRLAGGRKTG